MCLGQNSAHHAVHYLNAQLGALWENSVECVHHSGKGLKPLDRVRYDFALAEFHVGTKQRSKFTSKDDMMFSAVFGKPRLEFICGHEAVLYLKIKEGHFNRDFAKIETSSFLPNRGLNVQLNDLEIAFRLEFNINGFRGHTSEIGNGTHIIKMLVLNLNTAQLVSRVNISRGREALEFYLKKYLEFLRHAGHHVLFSLPSFDDDRPDVLIDYSLESHSIRNLDTEIDEILGVSLVDINRYLSSKWLKSIMDSADGADRGAICLAEYRSTWTSLGDHSDLQFHVKFGAPRVKALCNREVVLYLKIDELLVYDGRDFTKSPKHTYVDWEVAVVVDLVKDIQGTFNRVKLDMNSIRFSEHFSKFFGFDVSLDFAVTLKTTFVEFVYEYAAFLETAHFHIIHVIDVSKGGHSTSEGSETESEIPHGGEGLGLVGGHNQYEDIVKKTNTYGFEFIQVISQQSIIEHFRVLWQHSRDSTLDYAKILGNWSYGDDFKASFGALEIRYLSNGKALVWIQLDEGTLKPLKSSKTYDFSDWSVAFEVKFKIFDQEEVVSSSKSWFNRFAESFAWKQHGNQPHRTVKHLCLDFSTAEFIYELSKFEGLQLSNRSAVESVRGAVHYLREHYFHVLTQHGHHVLQSIPVWKTGLTPPPMALTGITFQIYSKRVIDRHNYVHVSRSFEASLVILGMTYFRPLPSTHLDYTTEWIIKKKRAVSHGTVCISSRVFLETRLLSLLHRVNATTTVVPAFPGTLAAKDCVTISPGHKGGPWRLVLSTFAPDSVKPDGGCKWKSVAGSRGHYEWNNVDKWSREHVGSVDDPNNGVYVVACQVKNTLRFPTSYQHGSLEIFLHGEIDIGVSFKGSTSHWSSKAVAKWSVTLSMTSEPGGSGVSIDVTGDVRPKFETFRVHGDASLEKLLDLDALHSLVHVDLVELVAELKQSFGGVWEHCFPGLQAYSLCNPVFNANGDILFELQPWVPRTHQSAALKARRPSRSQVKKQTSTVVVFDSDSVSEHDVTSKKSKSLLRRVGDGIVTAGQAVGGAIETVLSTDSSEEYQSKSRSAVTSNTSVVSSITEVEKSFQTSVQETSYTASAVEKATLVPNAVHVQLTTLPEPTLVSGVEKSIVQPEVKKLTTQPQNGKAVKTKANGNGAVGIA